VIGRDDQGEDFTLLYADERGVSRVYKMAFSGDVWTLHRQAPGFHQRFTGRFDPTGNVITAAWEASEDSTRWEHDFAMTFTRAG
jgi:hypothetical protein